MLGSLPLAWVLTSSTISHPRGTVQQLWHPLQATTWGRRPHSIQALTLGWPVPLWGHFPFPHWLGSDALYQVPTQHTQTHRHTSFVDNSIPCGLTTWATCLSLTPIAVPTLLCVTYWLYDWPNWERDGIGKNCPLEGPLLETDIVYLSKAVTGCCFFPWGPESSWLALRSHVV